MDVPISLPFPKKDMKNEETDVQADMYTSLFCFDEWMMNGWMNE